MPRFGRARLGTTCRVCHTASPSPRLPLAFAVHLDVGDHIDFRQTLDEPAGPFSWLSAPRSRSPKRRPLNAIRFLIASVTAREPGVRNVGARRSTRHPNVLSSKVSQIDGLSPWQASAAPVGQVTSNALDGTAVCSGRLYAECHFCLPFAVCKTRATAECDIGGRAFPNACGKDRVAGAGIEPATSWIYCLPADSDQLSYPANNFNDLQRPPEEA